MTETGVLLYNPLLPVWGMALCLAVFGVFAWLTYSRCALSLMQRLFLFSLRVSAFVILCWLLLQPVWRSHTEHQEQARLAVLVDVSASMEDVLPGVRKSRGEVAREILTGSELSRLGRTYRLLPYVFSDGVERVADFPDGVGGFSGGQSRLLAGLGQMRLETKSERPFACIVLTDGLDTSGLGMEGMVLDMPLIIPELEDASEIREDTSSEYSVSLPESSQGARRVVKGWKTSVRVSVNRLRGGGAATVPVTLIQGGQELETREVAFSADARYAQTVFELTPSELGNFSYAVEIRPSEDQERDNNRGEFALEVIEEQNRVLYLEGMARPDFKFLKRALLKERNFQASVYVRMGNGVFVNFEDGSGDGAELSGLLTEESLKRYKVLILGEFQADSFTGAQVAAIVSFVERGGGLLLAGASKAYGENGILAEGGLGRISPVRSTASARMVEGKGFPVSFSASGRNDGIFMKLASEASFAPINSVWKPVTLSEGSTTILETGDSQPVLAVRRYGAGRVCIFLSNTLYTLRLHGGASDGISVYDRLVSQTVLWMLPDMKTSSEADAVQLLLKSDSVDVGQKVAVGALCAAGSSSDMQCEVTSPDGKTGVLPMQQATLGGQVGLSNPRKGYVSEFKAEQAGTYALEIVRKDGQRSGRKLLVVRRPVIEMTGARVNRALLSSLAKASGGRFLPYGHFEDVLEGIRIPSRKKEIVVESSQWDSWWWLVPLMGLFCLEWYFRRRWEMV